MGNLIPEKGHLYNTYSKEDRTAKEENYTRIEINRDRQYAIHNAKSRLAEFESHGVPITECTECKLYGPTDPECEKCDGLGYVPELEFFPEEYEDD